jgi:hypothetical protein
LTVACCSCSYLSTLFTFDQGILFSASIHSKIYFNCYNM